MALQGEHKPIAEENAPFIDGESDPILHAEDAREDFHERVTHVVKGARESSDVFDVHEVFSSERFIQAIRSLKPEARKEAVGRALQYSQLHPDGFGFWDFLEDLKNVPFEQIAGFDQSSLSSCVLKAICKKLGLSEAESVESKKKILLYCEQHLQAEGNFFHGFNGVFADDIASQGLTVDKREWDWEEIREMNDILTRAGHSMALGWALMNCENKLSVSEVPKQTYWYAANSPEWFAHLTSEGTHIPFHKGARKAFSSRDYARARSNMEEFCDSMMHRDPAEIAAGKAYPNMTLAEKEKLLVFFEKYWEKFAGPKSVPKVALVKKAAVNDDWKGWCDIRIETRMENIGKTKAESILWSALNGGSIDQQCDHSISPEDIEIIDLPAYRQLLDEDTDATVV